MTDLENTPVDTADEVLLEVKNLQKYFVVDTSFFGKPTK